MISLPFAVPQISAKLIFGVAFALCFALIGMGIHKTFSDRKIARMEKTHAELVAKLHRDRADAEAEAREIEQQWRNKVTLQEADYMAAMAQRDHIVRDLVIVGNGLRNKLSQLTAVTAKPPQLPPPPAGMFISELKPSQYYSMKLIEWRKKADAQLTTLEMNSGSAVDTSKQ